MDYQIISKYQNNNELRHSFNELSKKVFGLDFENWYQNGFWKDNYIPYSIVINNKIVSNVSVNLCNFSYKGKEIILIQLGTIMTDPKYRGKGLAKAILSGILRNFEDKVDGIYLFANDSVLDFYPKFGFKKFEQFFYSKDVKINNEMTAIRVSMNNKFDWSKMVEVIKSKKQNSKFYMTDNIDLYMFYFSQFLTNNIFYIKEEDTYVVAEVEENTLTIHAIFGNTDIEKVILSFGKTIKKVILGFTPNNVKGYKKEQLIEEDTTLFVKGKFFADDAKRTLIFPQITRA